jgi:hypothetical protein
MGLRPRQRDRSALEVARMLSHRLPDTVQILDVQRDAPAACAQDCPEAGQVKRDGRATPHQAHFVRAVRGDAISAAVRTRSITHPRKSVTTPCEMGLVEEFLHDEPYASFYVVRGEVK